MWPPRGGPACIQGEQVIWGGCWDAGRAGISELFPSPHGNIKHDHSEGVREGTGAGEQRWPSPMHATTSLPQRPRRCSASLGCFLPWVLPVTSLKKQQPPSLLGTARGLVNSRSVQPPRGTQTLQPQLSRGRKLGLKSPELEGVTRAPWGQARTEEG
jgi:hypothetical protein